MKKLYSIIAMLFVVASSYAANAVYTLKSSFLATSDTITNTATGYVEVNITKSYETVSIQAVCTKISGTVAGNVLLQASNDGTNFVSVGLDTLATTDVATQSHTFIVHGSPYKYYRLSWTGSGTMSATLKGYLLPNGAGATNSIYTMKSSFNLTSDTATNTGTTYVGLQVQNAYKSLTVQAVVTKISGTVGGTVTLQGSNDGTNYNTVKTLYLETVAPYSVSGGTATLTALNQTTTTKIFNINGSPYAYYRLSYTGTGTMAATIKGYVWPQK